MTEKHVVAGGLVATLAAVPIVNMALTKAHVRRASTTPSTSAADAARFLTQCTFGPTDASIAALQTSGFAGWIANQQAMATSGSHKDFVDQQLATARLTNPTAQNKPSDFFFSFWLQAVTGPDQLRQRLKLALSQIFVISFKGPAMNVRGVASYYDMLGANAFGNFRTLLEQVTLHPMMGKYLTYIANSKEDPVSGRNPDENYAREIMQLMSIGLYRLNLDGTVQTDGTGAPIRTYSIADIQGLSKVFTGFSYFSTNPTTVGAGSTYQGGSVDPNYSVTPMIAYAGQHSISAKTFLGVTIPASTTENAAGDLKIALDTLFNHPNVGPFIGKQLIQRLVTSNPSPAYVARVASVFNNNGAGVRGDMAAVVSAILLDPEARDPAMANSQTFGKLREPVVRIANWARAFNAVSTTGTWMIADTSLATQLDETVMNSPSVFNFWRPGYSPPGTTMGGLGLVAPEFQIIDEVSVAGYLNTLKSAVDVGAGSYPTGTSAPDVQPNYGTEISLASNIPALLDRMNLLLLCGQMSSVLRARIQSAVGSVAIPGSTATQAQITAALTNRAKLAIFMTMASPEYLAQR